MAEERAPAGEGRVVVIGGGLGGLSAAIHLAASGRRVTLYEANPTLGGRANRLVLEDGEGGAYRFDTGPSLLNYPWVFEELFAAAGMDFRSEVPLLAVDPSVSFLWPDGERLSLSSNFERLGDELERLEPGSRPRLAAWLEDAGAKYRIAFDKLVSRNASSPGWLGALGWFGALSFAEARRVTVWRSFYRELGRFFGSRRIKEALGSYAMYLGGSPFSLPGFFTILPYGELAYGLWLPEGGIYALVEGMERAARKLGVEIHTSARVSAVEVVDGRARGVRVSVGQGREEGGERFVPASAVVSNVDVPTTDTRLLPPEAAPRARARAGRTEMTPGVLTFYWGLRRKVEGLPHHTIFLPEDYRGAFRDLTREGRIPADLPFYVADASATDPSLAPAGGSTLFVLVPTPVLSRLGEVDWPRVTAWVRERVLTRLAHHGLEVAPGDLAAEEVWTPAEWSRRFGLYDGSAFGAGHRLLQVGPFRASNVSREVPGLFYVGAGTVPGTGMPMVTLSGRLAAERVLAYAGSAGDEGGR